MGPIERRNAFYLLVILFLSYLFFFFNLGSYSLKEPDEGRYAEIPREMAEQGDYVVPHLNYTRYFEKPPLSYWVTAASYKLFGLDEWSFRFPNALVAFLCSLLLYVFGKRWFSAETGFFAAVILMSCFGFFTMARIVTMDMLFTGLLFGALLCFNEYYRSLKGAYRFLFHGCLAMATLAKGPAAIILVGATTLVFLFTEKRMSFLRNLLDVRGLVPFIVLAAPWFIAISLKEKEFFQFFFIDQNIMRFLTTRHCRSGPVYYFIPVLAGGMLPWSFLLPRAIVGLWRMRELRLFLIWSALIFVFFSASGSKLPPYILPVFPALALLLGHFFALYRQESAPMVGEIMFYVIFFAAVLAAGLFTLSGMSATSMKLAPNLQEILQSIRGLEIGMSVISAAMVCLLFVRKIRSFGSLFFVLTGFSLAVVMMLMLHVPVLDRQSTTKDLAKAINSFQPQTALVINYGAFDETLPFYTRRRISIADYRGELAMGAKYPDAQPFFLDKEALMTLFNSNQPVLVVTKVMSLPELTKIIGPVFGVLDCKNERCVITNRRVQPDYPFASNGANW